ncbi:LysR family transcriptional regulator [Bradyrhizobium sp. BR 10289]|uniref:LysR family transcriptional regulator n=1 Tax=Bradyrhizobium sp. BR 10289 TaxID=2749993 RepID=UPI001C654802|nr:LysR family transcriptional regulator [Bradyrhizobium sp. BR 10289]MBW7974202.1 LysR family transcriptional regulator [Bradyrhizobium sp. BR 10289]
MDRLEAMSIVLRTVEKGSLTAAAKALNMPLPTLSRKVSELEAYLGTKLLQRSTRKLTLTDAGQEYVAAVKRIMEDIEEVERAASSEYTTPRGELVLTAPLLFGQMYMLPIVTDFLATYPDINAQLLLSDRNLHLYDDHVDMAVRLGALPDSSMIATRVGSMDTVVVASPDLLAAHGTPKHPKDLKTMPCVVFAGPSSAIWSFSDPGAKREFGVDILPRLSVTAAEAAVQAALRRTGVTRVYRYHCASELQSGKLVQILRDFDVPPIPVHLVHAARGQLPLKMRVFLDFAADRLRSAMTKLR